MAFFSLFVKFFSSQKSLFLSLSVSLFLSLSLSFSLVLYEHELVSSKYGRF